LFAKGNYWIAMAARSLSAIAVAAEHRKAIHDILATRDDEVIESHAAIVQRIAFFWHGRLMIITKALQAQRAVSFTSHAYSLPGIWFFVHGN
jgi:hypothetical protein